MTGIVEFLTARLDEDEEAAIVAARDAAYQTGNEAPDWSVRAPLALWSAPLGRAFGEVSPTAIRAAVHIARHDPARVLAEVKAKRALIEHWRTYAEQHRRDDCDPEARSAWVALVNVLVTLAGVYRTHPDYAGDSFDDWTRPDDDPAWRADA